jgi:hypothetical protein
MSEFSPLLFEGAEQYDDRNKDGKKRKRKFNPLSTVGKKPVSENVGLSENVPTVPLTPEFRVPISLIVSPEIQDDQKRRTPHDESLHSDVWLGGAVRPPEHTADVIQFPEQSDSEEDDDEEDEEGRLRRKRKAEAADTEDENEDEDSKQLADIIPIDRNRSRHEDNSIQLPREQGSPQAPEIIQPVPAVHHESDAAPPPSEFDELLQRAGLDELAWALEEAPQQSESGTVIQPETREYSPAEANTGSDTIESYDASDSPPPGDSEGMGSRLGGGGDDGGREIPFGKAILPPHEHDTSVDLGEYIPRAVARKRALVAFAAGLMIGHHFGKRRLRREVAKTLQEAERTADAVAAEHAATAQQAERKAYNETTWKHRLGQERTADGAIRPTEQVPFPVVGQERTPTPVSVETDAKAGEVEPDPFNVQPEEHIERDAWHSIVVDKYGREDITAREQYGKAFRQEQREVQQSALSDDQPVDAGVVGTAVGHIPGPTAADVHTPYPVAPMPANAYPSLPAGLTSPQLPSGEPTREDSQHLLPAHAKSGTSFLLNPWVWLFAGLLILVFFGASLFG